MGRHAPRLKQCYRPVGASNLAACVPVIRASVQPESSKDELDYVTEGLEHEIRQASLFSPSPAVDTLDTPHEHTTPKSEEDAPSTHIEADDSDGFTEVLADGLDCLSSDDDDDDDEEEDEESEGGTDEGQKTTPIDKDVFSELSADELDLLTATEDEENDDEAPMTIEMGQASGVS